MQKQHLHRIDSAIPIVNYRDRRVPSSLEYNIVQIVDNFIRIRSFSSRDLIEILDFLNQIDDKQLLIDAQLFEHKVYSIFIIMVKDLLNKLHMFESSNLSSSSSTKLICKTNYSSIELLRQCLENLNEMKGFSSLAKFHIQDKQIMNTIKNCLYSNMFQRTEKVERRLLFKWPRYFQDYQDKTIQCYT
ncbi:hypothetical protein I4U23_027261 [Adineta vaga]|nr:hypothetical protein I4U23_027261 [Adineta vaga]